jgi:hypothetical protein
VTVSELPLAAKLADPLTTVGPVGLACTAPAKQVATATPMRRRLKVGVVLVPLMFSARRPVAADYNA